MPKKKAKTTDGGGKIFVRAADGSLYILSNDDKPLKLEDPDAETVEQILAEAERQVQERLIGVASLRGSSVNVDVPYLPELPS